MNTTSKYIKSAFVLLLIVFTISACYKKKDTIVIVNVKDSVTNDLVVGADVRLLYLAGNPDSTRIDVSATSNPQGQAVFNFNEPCRNIFFGCQNALLFSLLIAIYKRKQRKNKRRTTGGHFKTTQPQSQLWRPI